MEVGLGGVGVGGGRVEQSSYFRALHYRFADSAGYEIRERALSLTDGTFFSKFLEVCMDYINTQGVNFLKVGIGVGVWGV